MGEAHLKTKVTERTIDSDTGEIVDEKTVTYLAESEKDFYITYCSVLGLFKDLKLGEVKTIAWLVANASFNNNMVVVTSGVKQKIGAEMGISHFAVSNALPRLVKAGILYREGETEGKRDGVYYISPQYYWKGSLAERKKMLKVVLEIKKQEGK